jgi:hypothetical protein
MNQNNLIKILKIIIASLLAAMLFLTTRYGLGLSPDSIAYIKGADGLLTGNGTSYMSVQWPPLYSFMLAIFNSIGNHDILLGGRILHALLIAANFILINILFNKYLNINKWIAILLAFIVSLHEVLIYVEFYSWSEPLVISLILINFLLIEKYLNHQDKNTVPIEIGLIILATLSVSTRYIGINVAFINAVIVFLFARNTQLPNRMIRAVIQIAIPVLVIYPWLAWHSSIDDNNTTQRKIQFHPISLEKILDGLKNTGKWLHPYSSRFKELVPEPLLYFTGLVILTIIIYTLLVTINKIFRFHQANKDGCQIDNIKSSLIGFVALFITFYLSFLIASISFIDSKLSLDNRFLAPIFIPVIILVLGVFSEIKKTIIRNLLYCFFIILMAFSYFNLRSVLLISYFDGIEINSRSNINKSIYKTIKNYSSKCQIYSDLPWNIGLYFDKKVLWLPSQILFGTGLINQTYKYEIQQLANNADLIVIENKNDYLVNEINSLHAFKKIYNNDDGIIWINENINISICHSK